jgi:hypothetical protein
VTVTAFLLAWGATARLTRLVNSDVLTETARDALLARFRADSKPHYLLTCPWCASIWIAVPVVLAAWAADGADWFNVPAAILTISYLYGLVASHLDADDED